MNSIIKRLRKQLWLGLTIVLAGTVVVTSCTASQPAAKPSSAPSESKAAPAAAPAKPQVSPDQLQKLIKHVILKDVPASQLDPLIVEALTVAAQPLTDSQKALAVKCFTDLSCETGRGNLTVGIADGFGDNVWRKFTLMEAILQSVAYPQVAKIVYTNAHGDLAQAQANFRSLIAQKVNIIIGYFDHGDAMIPLMREATKAGIAVVPYGGGVPGANAPTDILAQTNSDLSAVGREMVTFTIENIGKEGNAVFFTGTPGNPQGATWQKAAEEEFAKYPGWKVVGKADTQWTQEGAFKAASGIIAQGGKVDVIFYDYANATRGIVRAYQQAGKPIPAQVTWTEDNELLNQWEQLRGSNPNFKLGFTHSFNWSPRVAITAAIAKLVDGRAIPAKIAYPQPVILAEPGMYDKTKPGEFPASTTVPEDLIAKMLK